MIDLYCERTGPGLWAEPLNALSNAAFVVVAALLWRMAARDRAPGFAVGGLTALIVAVGFGSFLWHLLATPWARWLDLVALLALQMAWLWSYLRGAVGSSIAESALVLLGFAVALLPAARFSQPGDGLLLYLPALAALLALGLQRRSRPVREPNLLLGAAAAFAVSLLLRTADRYLCASIPFGTHFAWHLLDALVVYLAMRALLLDRADGRRGGAD